MRNFHLIFVDLVVASFPTYSPKKYSIQYNNEKQLEILTFKKFNQIMFGIFFNTRLK